MKIRLVIFLFVLIAVSCSKDKFGSRPSLKVKSMSGNYIPYDPDGTTNYGVQITLEYADGDGDIAGAPFYIQKLSSSASPDHPCINGYEPFYTTDSSQYPIPTDVPVSANQKGEIIITIATSPNDLVRAISCDRTDTLENATFKFWFKDQAGNPSDTATSGIIKIQKPG